MPKTPQSLLPATVMPGVVNKYLTPQTIPMDKPQPIMAPSEKPGALVGQAAKEIKFQLNDLKIVGNTVYSQKDLEPLYKDKIKKQITIAELQQIVLKITSYYRNNGYILTRAVLPPQHVSNGAVTIRVVEGYIDKVRVVGDAKGADKILLTFGENIAKSRPLRVSVMEYYMRLANEVPGVQVKAVLEPSKNLVGASDLNLTTSAQRIQSFFSYDNYGTLYLGPNQLTGSVNANSIVKSGDSTKLLYIQTTRPKQLQYTDISYRTYLGTTGVSATVGGNVSFTRPGLNLAQLRVNGYGATYYGTLTYPLIRTRDQDLTVDGSFSYLDSQVTTNIIETLPLYTDHVRSVSVGGIYNFSDRFSGVNYVDVHAEEGLNILGASQDVTSLKTSRFGGYACFTKITTALSRIQQLSNRFSGYIMMTGQYSVVPLLASEQFSFGGSQMGRGYSPAEIIGDRGMGGTLELRMQFVPGLDLLQSAQPYIFYDGGVIWNMKNVAGIPQKQSITSTGGGIRFGFTSHVSGNFMVAQPLTKQNFAEEQRGDGRRLQGYFSLTAYM